MVGALISGCFVPCRYCCCVVPCRYCCVVPCRYCCCVVPCRYCCVVPCRYCCGGGWCLDQWSCSMQVLLLCGSMQVLLCCSMQVLLWGWLVPWSVVVFHAVAVWFHAGIVVLFHAGIVVGVVSALISGSVVPCRYCCCAVLWDHPGPLHLQQPVTRVQRQNQTGKMPDSSSPIQ